MYDPIFLVLIMNDKDTNFGNKFSFDENVTACFSNMLERSIPTYQLMRELIFLLSCNYASNTTILDIGTSLGDSIYKLACEFKNSNFIGIENSDSMFNKATERFSEFNNVEIRKHDIRQKLYLQDNCGLILSILTIQFTPIEYRNQILENIYKLLTDNGAFIFVEKVIGNNASMDSLFVKTYYQIKENNGYSFEEIQRKKLALEGVLVPVTAKWNEELLKMAGFSKVECFWRCLNFSGWIAIK